MSNGTETALTTATAVCAAKVAPSVAVTAADKLSAIPVGDLVMWATLIYTVLMILHLLYKFGREEIERRRPPPPPPAHAGHIPPRPFPPHTGHCPQQKKPPRAP
jgi:hypothetical protein